jgi:hypothetical protein
VKTEPGAVSEFDPVQKMLGHASAAMTLDIYAGLFDDDLEAVATALQDARGRENVGTRRRADRSIGPLTRRADPELT